jgi:hypothetical protein
VHRALLGTHPRDHAPKHVHAHAHAYARQGKVAPFANLPPQATRWRPTRHGPRCRHRGRLSAPGVQTPSRRRVCVPVHAQASVEPRRPWPP